MLNLAKKESANIVTVDILINWKKCLRNVYVIDESISIQLATLVIDNESTVILMKIKSDNYVIFIVKF